MSRTIIYCPYCGEPNTFEDDLILELRTDEVYLLECGKCKKTSTVILYDSSEEILKPNENVGK